MELIRRLLKALYYPFLWAHVKPTPVVSIIQLNSKENQWRDVDAVVGIPFGSHQEGQPVGQSNRDIARNMCVFREAHARGEVQFATQWEIADVLARHGVQANLITGERWNNHIPSYEFFSSLRSARPDWKKIILIAHPDHLRRCILIAKKLGFEVLVPPPEDGIKQVRYDPKSSQVWCRSKWALRIPRELDFQHGPSGFVYSIMKYQGFFWWERLVMVDHALKGWI